MNIKKSIVGSLFSMLLVSEMAAADWGDVYYCQMTNFIEVKPNGELTNYKPEKFQFKLDFSKYAVVFGDKGYFNNSVYKLVEFDSFPSQEMFFIKSKHTSGFFEKGSFVYSDLGVDARVISADCEKF